MKIGVFGGSFDPIHMGHLLIGEFAKEFMNLDKVIFIPVGNPSHRENSLSKNIDRYNMVKLAIENNSSFEISDIEFTKEGVNYTYDTLLELKNIYKNAEIFEIIGEDSADYLDKWKNYEELITLCNFLVFRREGYNYLSKNSNIVIMDNPKIGLSATLIRERVAKGQSIKYMVPEKVEEYIKKEKLYSKD